MRKVVVPLLASLLLCGAAASALVATNARAQTEPRKPMLVAQNTETPPATPNMGRMQRFSPADIAAFRKARCEDQYARAVGRSAYLEARLTLTGSQQQLFSAWRAVRLDIAKRRAGDCTDRSANQDRADLNPVDRMARMEDMLKKRITDLDAERPAFAALYNALSPDQRKALSPDRDGMMRRGMWGHHGMARGMMGPGARPNSASPPQ